MSTSKEVLFKDLEPHHVFIFVHPRPGKHRTSHRTKYMKLDELSAVYVRKGRSDYYRLCGEPFEVEPDTLAKIVWLVRFDD